MSYRSLFTLFRGELNAYDEKNVVVAVFSGNEFNSGSWGLRVQNDLGRTVHFDNSVRHRDSRSRPTEWIDLKVKVRFSGLSKSSDHHFRFRFVKERDFEVEVVNTATK